MYWSIEPKEHKIVLLSKYLQTALYMRLPFIQRPKNTIKIHDTSQTF
uniref:Uncharacterized protein n=1 Tax=Anguilla anguilla TaxID=7936 RepID=A0A0E9WJC0_ANGAN